MISHGVYVDDPESIKAYNKSQRKIIVKKNSIPETFTELKPNTRWYFLQWEMGFRI